PHEVIQRYVASHDVAASFAGSQLDLTVPPQRLNRLRLNQREFVIRLGLEEGAQLQRVSVTLKPRAQNRHHLSNCLHLPLGGGGDVNRFHSSGPHYAPPAITRFSRRSSFRRS